MPCVPSCRRALCPARRRSAPWKSLTSWSRSSAASTVARWGTGPGMAIWIPRSPSAPRSSSTVSCMCRLAVASSPTRCPSWNGKKPSTSVARCSAPWRWPNNRPSEELSMLLMIDNYDSFTWNVVQYLGELGAEVKVVRNDELSVAQIEALQPERIVISPGPCTPNEAGVSVPVLQHFAGKLPILGICLGHQSIGQAFGGEVVRAREAMHGKTSPVYHRGVGVFVGLANPLTVTRYHSLVVQRDTLPDCLEMTAWTQHADGTMDEIMGVRHRQYMIEGVQFHPESILSEQGHELLANFLKQQGGMRS